MHFIVGGAFLFAFFKNYYFTAIIKSFLWDIHSSTLSICFPDNLTIFHIHSSIQWAEFVNFSFVKFKLKSDFKILINDWPLSWL